MSWTTLVAGTTITSAWANTNVRDQTVSNFASTATRDAAITAPTEGLVAFQTDTNAVTQYASATTGWQPIWNTAWGVLAYAAVTASQTGIGVGPTDITSLTSGSITYVANRRIKITVFCRYLQNTSTGNNEVNIVSGSTIIEKSTTTNAAGIINTTCVQAIVTSVAGALTYKASASVNAGTMDIFGSATQPAWICVEDVGPAGAPT